MESFARREMECFSCVGRGGGRTKDLLLNEQKGGAELRKNVP